MLAPVPICVYIRDMDADMMSRQFAEGNPQMTDAITTRIAAVRQAIASDSIIAACAARSMGDPIRTDGAWIVWEQWDSRGSMDRAVAVCKAAGLPAFFDKHERRFGVRAQ